jgi:hypothetical protein
MTIFHCSIILFFYILLFNYYTLIYFRSPYYKSHHFFPYPHNTKARDESIIYVKSLHFYL